MKRAFSVPSPRSIGAANAFIEARLALGRVAFSLEELTQQTELSAIAAKYQLLRLPGKVLRVSPRQSFFLIVSAEHRSMGAPPPSWWLDDYFNWLGRPYYLALQSAASVFGSNPQALQSTQVMTDQPRRTVRVGRMTIQFFVKRGIGRSPTLQPSGAAAPLLVSTPEVTAYDLIRYAPRIGGIERAAETIRPLLPLLRARKLQHVLEAENEPAVAQRLGFVIEACDHGRLAQAVRDWLPKELTPVPLSAARGKRDGAALVKRWQVLNNSGELNV